MNRGRPIFTLVILCLAMTSCGSPKYTGDKRFPLSGTVKVDGNMMDFGTISFIPMDQKTQRVSGGPIRDGKYEVSEEEGANTGTYRIEIRWHKATGEKVPDPLGNGEMNDVRVEGLPARFHTESELTAEVSDGHTNFDFDLQSKSQQP